MNKYIYIYMPLLYWAHFMMCDGWLVHKEAEGLTERVGVWEHFYLGGAMSFTAMVVSDVLQAAPASSASLTASTPR